MKEDIEYDTECSRQRVKYDYSNSLSYRYSHYYYHHRPIETKVAPLLMK